jgi:hypothetical protein
MAEAVVRLHLDVTDGLDDPLAVIDGIVGASRGIEAALREWVRVARSKGHTWQEIARALRVTRQSAWERFRDVQDRQRSEPDPSFASAVERAYLRELSTMRLEPDVDLDAIHEELLARAIYAADRTNGGLRFKRLDEAAGLRARLRRVLSVRADR